MNEKRLRDLVNKWRMAADTFSEGAGLLSTPASVRNQRRSKAETYSVCAAQLEAELNNSGAAQKLLGGA